MSKRSIRALLLATSLALPTPAFAGETPLAGPAPDWVTPAPELADKDVPRSGNTIPVFDEQFLIDGDTSTGYLDTAYVVSSPELLNKLGTFTVNWQPAHGDLTLHRMEILRGSERIDLMKNGPGLTVLRREAGLERQIMDGTLTAVRQVEGLRIGDVLRVAFSVSERDSVLGGKAQTSVFLAPRPMRIGFGRARLVWPKARPIAWKALLPGIEATARAAAGNRNELVVPMPIAALPEVPDDAPARFKPLPMISATSFAGWQEVADVMAPLYRTEGAIAEGSDLARVVDGIAAKNSDPVTRIAEALKVVQSDVRYQLIALGTGNYAPQAPRETWDKRYGDCKAKTLLLIAMLRRMGITAEPVLAHSKLGDVVPKMLPAPLAFDHVFVRAEVAGESFWLDGTSLGARLADVRDVPRFGHVLPLREKGAELIKLPLRADARPSTDVDLAYDGTAGAHLPMPFTLKVRYTGPWAEQLRTNGNADAEESLRNLAESAAKTWTGSSTILKPSGAYDAADGSWTLTVEGLGYPEWKFQENRLELEVEPTLKVDFNPDRSRSAWREIPALIAKPWTAHARVSLALPPEGAEAKVEGFETVNIDLPSVAWERSIDRQGARIVERVVSRESGAEVPPNEISTTRKAIADAVGKPMRIAMPASYPQRWDDVARMRGTPALARIRAVFDRRIADKPEDADRYSDRGWLGERLLDWAAAEADYAKALSLDGSADRYLRRAEVRATRGDLAGALKDAQSAYDLDPGKKEVRAQLASQLSQAGKTDEALDLIEANPDVASEDGEEAMLNRAEVLSRGGRLGEAVALLDGGLAKRASSAALLNGRCWFRALGNVDLEPALADCSRAIEIAAEPAAYYDSRAMVHFRAGRLAEAKADLDAALRIDPELAATLFMRGVVAKRQGNAASGASDLAAARKLYPAIDAFFARYGIKP